MLWIAKATFCVCTWECAPPSSIPSSLLWPCTVAYDFALVHREQDFDEDIEDEDVPFAIDMKAAADTSRKVKQQLVALLNKIDELIKLQARFNDIRSGEKKRTFSH